MSSHLTLTVDGRDYVVPSPPARIGLALQASYTIAQARRLKVDPPAYALARASLYDDLTSSLDEDALGPAWDEMVDADVSLADLRRASQAAYVWIVTGSESAAHAIMSGGAVEDGGSGPKVSTTTDGEPTTPPPDSMSGTTSPMESSTA